jgi:hypothetical protein
MKVPIFLIDSSTYSFNSFPRCSMKASKDGSRYLQWEPKPEVGDMSYRSPLD